MMMPTWLFYVFYVSLGWVVGMVSVMAYMLGAIRARVRAMDLELVTMRHALEDIARRLRNRS